MSIPQKEKQRKLVERSIEPRGLHENSTLRRPNVVQVIRAVILFLLIASVLLLSLNKTAWATPTQSPLGQTVPTKTPGQAPELTNTPTITPDTPQAPANTPTITSDTPQAPANTPETQAEPIVTPAQPPTLLSTPGVPAEPTVVIIVDVPSVLPNTGAASTAPVWWIWVLAITTLAVGAGLRLWIRRSRCR